MSLFGKLASMKDVLARIPQLESQVVRLENEDSGSGEDGTHGVRASFVQRCMELGKQIEDQRRKVESMQSREGADRQKMDVLLKLAQYQSRLSLLSPERERSSGSGATEGRGVTDRSIDSESIRGKFEPRKEAEPTAPIGRRPSMYDPIDSSEEDSDNEGSDEPGMAEPVKGAESQRGAEPAVPGAPAPAQQNPVAVTRVQPRGSIAKERMSSPPESAQSRSQSVSAQAPSSSSHASSGPASMSRSTPPTSGGLVEVEGNRFEVLADLVPEESTDLPLTKGEILVIVQTRADGWWTAKNRVGLQGLVPKTYLRHVKEESPTRGKKRDSPVKEEVPTVPVEAVVRVTTQPFMTSEEQDVKETEKRRVDVLASHQKPPHLLPVQAPPLQVQPISRQPHPPQAPPSPGDLPRMDRVERVETTQAPPPIRCLGDALRQDCHLTTACHLTPKLSHSNLSFHDLSWNYHEDRLRVRHVKVSRLIRLVRLEGMPREGAESKGAWPEGAEPCCGLVRAALYDTGRQTGRQLVSNVHSIRAQVKNGTWTFVSRTDTANSGVDLGDFIIRSNYASSHVVLLLEASVVYSMECGCREISLGILPIPLVAGSGECCLANKTYTDNLVSENIFEGKKGQKTSRKIVYKVLDVPKEMVRMVDSMPDLLLFNPMFTHLFFFYRRRLGTVLIRDRNNPLSAEMISDPLLSVFPHLSDQPDLLDLLRSLWISRLKTMRNKSETEQSISFFQIFMNTAYCIHRTALIPDYSIWDRRALRQRHEVFSKCVEMYREYKSAARFLLTTPTRPINIFDYSIDLLGIHAID